MRVYKVKIFNRFQRREGISDASLVKAVRDAANGLIDADLGGGLIKQRIARSGGGKSGGYRTVLAYRRGQRRCFYTALRSRCEPTSTMTSSTC